ncbi:MAG: hydroxy-tetrahydrodipicolinate reductase [Candidatus Tokpelaia sp. JSC161]|jgi:2,3-bisphosphoglycerate-dependent phosphoglycerate mutase|nr:MAG: hydroxy-tetrahydrodipicolinate reductase [Candidatus Tokpelaia sp. JSC161]
MQHTLVLIRHGQSEWNLKNLFTGLRDPDLTEKGYKDAVLAGRRLKMIGLEFDIAFTSGLRRAQVTCRSILDEMGQSSMDMIKTQALNERDYGDLSGLDKNDVRRRWGEEQVHIWRRSYDISPPGGESLRDTGARVWLYYINKVQPHVLRGERVLIVAHGNSLRALMMAIEGLDSDTIMNQEIETAVPIIYELHADSTMSAKKVLGKLLEKELT